MKILELYTDGGCHGNPGPGGWAYVLLGLDSIQEEYGNDSMTTNNKMELSAVINGLQFVAQSELAVEKIHIYTDSQYVKNGITSWIINWKRNGWKTANKKPVKNKELWMALDVVQQLFNVEWHWVKGHSGNKYNERCDSLVQEAIAEIE